MRTWVLDNLALKLLSILLAVFLWAVVLREQKAEVTVNIPLEFRDVPRDLVLVNDPVDTLQVRLRGPQTLVTSLAPRDAVLNSRPRKFVEGDNTIQIRQDEVRVPRGIEVIEVNPHRVRLVLDAIVEREVEVSPRVQGALGKSFVLKRVTPSPPRIRMAGPKSELQRLSRVYTTPISLEGQTTSFSTRVMLEPVGRQVRTLDDIPIIVGVEIGARRS
jgi:YbbR domain-containing protein